MMQNKGAGSMQVIGITGGIGSGKSEVLHFLSRQQGVKLVERQFGEGFDVQLHGRDPSKSIESSTAVYHMPPPLAISPLSNRG